VEKERDGRERERAGGEIGKGKEERKEDGGKVERGGRWGEIGG